MDEARARPAPSRRPSARHGTIRPWRCARRYELVAIADHRRRSWSSSHVLTCRCRRSPSRAASRRRRIRGRRRRCRRSDRGPPYVMSEMIAAEPALARAARASARRKDALGSRWPMRMRGAVDAGRPDPHHRLRDLRARRDGDRRAAVRGARACPPGREVRPVQALEAAAAAARRRACSSPISHEGGTKVTNEAIHAARAAGAQTALISVGDGIAGCAGSPGGSWCGPRSRTRAGATPIGYLAPLTGSARGARGTGCAELAQTPWPSGRQHRRRRGLTRGPRRGWLPPCRAGRSPPRGRHGGGSHVGTSARARAEDRGGCPRSRHRARARNRAPRAPRRRRRRWTGLIVIQADPVAGNRPRGRTGRTAATRGKRPRRTNRRHRRARAWMGRWIPEAETPAGRLVLPRGSRVRRPRRAAAGRRHRAPDS